MQLTCPFCGSGSPSENGRLVTEEAMCPACHEVFRLDSSPSHPKPGKGLGLTRVRVWEGPGRLEITWRWFNPSLHLFLAGWATVWDLILVLVYGEGFKDGNGWLAALSLPLAAAGIILTYATMTGFWNRTTLQVSREGIWLRGGPLPAVRALHYRPGDLRRVYAWKVPTRTPSGASEFQVLATESGGGETCLVRSLRYEAQALFLAQKIREFLGVNL
ncbi:MAG TPA: hypothetical protein VEN81_14965 [Planctomycetota bacterium]|nr:hypothetical protein [Planctomycetota bacterium]